MSETSVETTDDTRPGNRGSQTQRYRVELKAWIPQEKVLDPELIFRQADCLLTLPFINEVKVLLLEKLVARDCWPCPPEGLREIYDKGPEDAIDTNIDNGAIRDVVRKHLDFIPDPLVGQFVPEVSCVIESHYEGDNHGDYDGDFRVRSWIEFDWDGSAISNVDGGGGHGQTRRPWSSAIFLELPDWTPGPTRVRLPIHDDSGVDTDTQTKETTHKKIGESSFRLGFSSGIPTTITCNPPQITASVEGEVGDGVIRFSECLTDGFPSYGLRVKRVDRGNEVISTQLLHDAYGKTVYPFTVERAVQLAKDLSRETHRDCHDVSLPGGNGSDNGDTAGEHALVIAGSEKEGSTNYQFKVSGRTQIRDGHFAGYSVSKNPGDRLTRNGGEGRVGGGNDGYTFTGELLNFTLDDPSAANVYVDGRKISPSDDRLPNTLVIEGTGPRTEYEIAVSGQIKGVNGRLGDFNVGVGGSDNIGRNRVRGVVSTGNDGYRFSGEMEILKIDDPSVVNVYKNGEEIDIGEPETLPRTIIISGSGTRSEYEINVSGGIEGVNGQLEGFEVGVGGTDQISETTVKGVVSTGNDGYRFSGDYSLDVEKPNAVTVYIDGREKPLNGDKKNTIVIAGGEKEGSTSYDFQVDGTVEQIDGQLAGYSVSKNPGDRATSAGGRGSVGGGNDGYRFSGEFKGVNLADPSAANVYVNGEQINTGDGGEPPVAQFSITPPTPTKHESFVLDASGSSDPDGQIDGYAWSISRNGSRTLTGNGERFVVTLERPGTYTATLTVTGADGRSSQTSKSFAIAPIDDSTNGSNGGSDDQDSGEGGSSDKSPTARIAAPDLSRIYTDQLVSFDGSYSSDPDGQIQNYAWSIDEASGSGNGAKFTHRFNDPGTYTVRLTVTDEDGNVDEAFTNVRIKKAPIAPS